MFEGDIAKLLEHTSDAAFVVDLHGEIRIWNRAAENLFGYPASSVIGKLCAPIVGGRIESNLQVCCHECDILRCARNGVEISNFDMEITTSLGERVWVNVSILVASNERIDRRFVIHLMRDIGKRKKAEELANKILRLAQSLGSDTDQIGGMPPVSPLTEQERQILSLLAAGKTLKEIASELGISTHTLRNHINNVDRKLHTRSRLQAVLQALKRKLI